MSVCTRHARRVDDTAQDADEWADRFLLPPAFIAAYGISALADVGAEARFLVNGGVEADASLTKADRAHRSALGVAVDAYLEVRSTRWVSTRD